jgi:RimJ/RimL family protein N-acetyltransferase
MFNSQPTLSDGTYLLRPLTPADQTDLRQAASDPLIWAGHPASTRHLPDVFDPYFAKLLTFCDTLVITHGSETIGCSAYYTASTQPDTIAIGYTFLTRNFWGGTANKAIKTLMLDHAFQTFDTVWLHIGPNNIRSQKATQKLGAIYTHTDVMDTTSGPTEMRYYKLTRSTWRDRIGQ